MLAVGVMLALLVSVLLLPAGVQAQGVGPPAPTNVSATVLASDVIVSWTDSPGAVGHLVILFKSDFSGDPLIGAPPSSPHTFRGVAAGSYIAVVVALDANADYQYAISALVTVLQQTDDRAALVALYHAAGGPNWTNNDNWLSNRPIGEWHGVTTDESGRVTQLALPFNTNLRGTLPAELGNLSSLTRLSLESNHLSGPIPASLGNLSNLTYLGLGGNDLSGPIPTELGNLSNLTTLYLRVNQLSGSIPASMGNLSSLTSLDLRGNQLSGSIPASMGNLSSLSDLDLRNNQLSGPIPAELGNLSNLTHLSLMRNRLSGPIPAELGNLSSLSYLHLGDNQLSGPIPASLGNLSSLSDLHLGGNRLSGPIPASLGNLSNQLEDLFLHPNQLTGCIPAALAAVYRHDLDELGLPFCGNVGSAAGDRAALVAFYNAAGGPNWTNNGNWLSARPIGEWHGVTTDDSGRVTELRLRDNNLRGTLPAELGNLSNLTYLSLWDNRLSGPIPARLGNLSNLTDLRLWDNQLSGPIPSQLGNLTSLTWLLLARNQFSGPIPARLGNLSNLVGLGFDGNRLSGPIPAELGNLSDLTELHLWDNQLSGPIPSELGSLTNLAILYLSGNRLTGCVPQSLQGIANNDFASLGLPFCSNSGSAAGDRAALVALYNATGGPNWTDNDNWLSGRPIGEWHGVTTNADGRVTTLGIQRNRLSGAIPSDLGNLTNLAHLYLSNNNLSGPIPLEIGKLIGLKRLSLNQNNLAAGPIPVEFANLINLEALHLDVGHCAPRDIRNWMRERRLDVTPCTGPDGRLLPRALLREDSDGLSLALDDDLHDPQAVNVPDSTVVAAEVRNGLLVLSPRGRGVAEVEIVPSSGRTIATATVEVRVAVGTFGIDIVMEQPATDLYAETIATAADRWSSVLNGTEWESRDAWEHCEYLKPHVPVASSGNELVIWARRNTDPSFAGGANAGACRRKEGPVTEPSHYYPVLGTVTTSAQVTHFFGDVFIMRHEIGHVLGLTGAFPPATGLVTEDKKYFIGSLAVAAFREGGGDPDLPGIPLSGSHWGWGVRNEVMIGGSDDPIPDELSVAALADAGYTVDMSKTTPWSQLGVQ